MTTNQTDRSNLAKIASSYWVRTVAKQLPSEEKRRRHLPQHLLESQDPSVEFKPPPLNITILIVGSRGDVQPFLGLGKALIADGHRVRLGTHEVFRDFVKRAGLGFYPIGGDPAELMAYMTKNPGLVPSLSSIRDGDIGRKRATIATFIRGCWKACVEPNDETGESWSTDAIISNPVTFAHVHVAERLAVPLHIFFTMPWSPTKAFGHPLANLKDKSAARLSERLSVRTQQNAHNRKSAATRRSSGDSLAKVGVVEASSPTDAHDSPQQVQSEAQQTTPLPNATPPLPMATAEAFTPGSDSTSLPTATAEASTPGSDSTSLPTATAETSTPTNNDPSPPKPNADFRRDSATTKASASSSKGSMINKQSYYAVQTLTWEGLEDLFNDFRKELGLSTIPSSSMVGPNLMTTLKVPHTYCWSPSLIPKPADWDDNIDVCGFFFLDLASDYTPDPELEAFLDAGPPPVYIGFGSIVVEDKQKLIDTVLGAIAEVPGIRAIVSQGWGGLSAEDAPDNVYFIGNCPHDWLFKRVSAVVCHGGAGTTAAALLCGKPVFVVSFFGDQPFWGSMITRAGAGVTVPHKKLNVQNLACGIEICLEPETADAAEAMGAAMRQENGLAAGVKSFYSHLPWKSMRCDLNQNRKADVFWRKYNVKLSHESVAELKRCGAMHPSQVSKLRLWAPKPWPIRDLSVATQLFSGCARCVSIGGGTMALAPVELVQKTVGETKKSNNKVWGVTKGFTKGTGRMMYKLTDGMFICLNEVGTGCFNSAATVSRKKGRRAKGIQADTFLEGLGKAPLYVVRGVVEPFKDFATDGFVTGMTSICTKPLGGGYLAFALPWKGAQSSMRNLKLKKQFLYTPTTAWFDES